MSIKGQVISGEFSSVLVRQKSGAELELGELLVSDTKDGKMILQVTDLLYGSQISQEKLELVSGIRLEEEGQFETYDAHLRHYNLAKLKSLLVVRDKQAMLSKKLPDFFSTVREITRQDLDFFNTPKDPLFVGKLRSGSKVLDVDIALDGAEVLKHHILIPATTGRGKSNLVKVMLWSALGQDYSGILVLDPHDEYYGRHDLGLKDHPKNDKVIYYTPKNPPPGCRTLKINIKSVKPQHFSGVADFSDPQRQALQMYYKTDGENWIESIVLERPLNNVSFKEDTLAVVKRRVVQLLDIDYNRAENKFETKGIFDFSAGETTIQDICNELEKGKIVIIDTSGLSGETELLIGSLICNEIFSRYKHYKLNGDLDRKPVVSIVLEEAPRVLGKDVLEKGSNVFSSIAREGRKFKIGLTAITQLPSLIPRDILANMNTKIILGIEMQPERQAIIDSASQDLSDDDRTIASLDKGEAIISSNFVKFPIPIKIPRFEEIAKGSRSKSVPDLSEFSR